MAKIAIDIVLLPSEDIMDNAIEINKQLVDDTIKLNKENCLPHISLCMGVLEEENLLKVSKILTQIADDFSKITLKVTGINDEHIAFDIEKTEGLRKLHEEIMIKLEPYLTYDATIDMCFSPPLVVEKTLYWINKYRNKSSFENFYPHITLGKSKIKNKELSIPFTTSRLAICHLGNYCTCRKILHEIRLQ